MCKTCSLLLHVLVYIIIVCCDLYLQFADSHSQSPVNSVVNSKAKYCQPIAANGSEGAQNTWATQLVWKAHICRALESSQETGVEQFPDHETSATWLLVYVETSCQMAPGDYWSTGVHEKIELVKLPQRSSGNGTYLNLLLTVCENWD